MIAERIARISQSYFTIAIARVLISNTPFNLLYLRKANTPNSHQIDITESPDQLTRNLW